MTRLFRFFAVAVSLVLVVASCASATERAQPLNDDGLAGYERDPLPIVEDITLPAADGSGDFTFKAQPNKLLMVTFGFTNCPDICPTTLADTRIAFHQLGDRAKDVDLAWASIDPDNDTAEAVANYVTTFIDDAIGLRTGDPEELAIAADAFGVSYGTEEDADGNLVVAHTPHIYLVDDSGSIVLTWTFGVTSDDLASDLNILLDRIEAA